MQKQGSEVNVFYRFIIKNVIFLLITVHLIFKSKHFNVVKSVNDKNTYRKKVSCIYLTLLKFSDIVTSLKIKTESVNGHTLTYVSLSSHHTKLKDVG
jgi:hypothetical protein